MMRFVFYRYVSVALILILIAHEANSNIILKWFSREKVPEQPEEGPVKKVADNQKIQLSKGALRNVKSPFKTLEDSTVNDFIRIANAAQDDYFLIDVVFASTPDEYKNYANNEKCVLQILYAGPTSAKKGKGHYICVFYDKNQKKVIVYDTLYVEGRSLGEKLKTILENLFPSINTNTDIVFVVPGTLQNDFSACGVFSIANAVAIIFGQKPEDNLYKVNCIFDQSYYLREHLWNILFTQELRPFPIATKHSRCSSAKNKIFQYLRSTKKVLE